MVLRMALIPLTRHGRHHFAVRLLGGIQATGLQAPDFSGALAQVIPELQSRLGREFDRLIDTGRQLSRAELVQVVLDGLDEAVAS
jgi:hypothetical protein